MLVNFAPEIHEAVGQPSLTHSACKNGLSVCVRVRVRVIF